MKTRYWYVAAALLLVVVMVGCSGEEETTSGPAKVGEAPTSAESMPAMDAQIVKVDLTEWSVKFTPPTAKPGMIHFEVKNSGTTNHNLEIEGQGVEVSLKDNLKPGESGMMMATLKAGTYETYCPIGKHAEKGMKGTFKVE